MKKEQKPVKINVKKLQNKKVLDDDDEEVENFFVDATLLYEDEGDVLCFILNLQEIKNQEKVQEKHLKQKKIMMIFT